MNKRIDLAVKKVLEESKEARCNDFKLISEVFKELGYSETYTLSDIAFLSSIEDGEKFPSFESITRARRKIQELYPSLLDDETKQKRAEECERVLGHLHDTDMEFIESHKRN